MVDLHLRTRGTVATAIAALLLVGPTVTWPQSNAATRDTHARVALRGHAVQGLTQAGPATDLPGAAMAEPRREVGPQTSGPQALGPQAPEADAPSGAGLEGPTGAEGTSLGAADDVVVSVPVATGGLLGLSWPRGTVTATTAAVRTFGGSGWSPWYISPVEAITDTESTGAQRPGTEPIWVGVDVTRIQVRLPAKARAAFATAQLDVYTPGMSPQPAAPPARASAAAVRPTIISRAQWGADESLRQGCVPSWADTTRAATVHHTAGSNTYTAAESAGIVRSVMKYHIQGRGWCDIGYNALVDRYGQIFEGRIGGLTNPVIGAHSLGFNSRNFGISVMGDFTVANVPAVTIDALSSIIAMRFHDFYVNPNGTATLTSSDSGSHYPAGTTVTFPTIDGHRDFQSTACPGAKTVCRPANHPGQGRRPGTLHRQRPLRSVSAAGWTRRNGRDRHGRSDPLRAPSPRLRQRLGHLDPC
ncbi:MAG: N-acetylmuramoyl-L-alanine amidase [Actinomycetales bacterium]|nr:N-acetylmuramoyl-L-alanine amidase [Actinomycetales bacterium]